MLILQRKPGESVMIGSDISISVISVDGTHSAVYATEVSDEEYAVRP